MTSNPHPQSDLENWIGERIADEVEKAAKGLMTNCEQAAKDILREAASRLSQNTALGLPERPQALDGGEVEVVWLPELMRELDAAEADFADDLADIEERDGPMHARSVQDAGPEYTLPIWQLRALIASYRSLTEQVAGLTYARDHWKIWHDEAIANAAEAALGGREGWTTVTADRVLYVDQGCETVLCDRLPSPVTLLLKLSALPTQGEGGQGASQDHAPSVTAVTSGQPETPAQESDQ